MSVFSIDEIPWSDPRIVPTKHGARRARNWKIPEGSPFWNLWHTGYLKQQGYQVSKWNNEWYVTEWREPDGAMLSGSGESVAAARAQAAEEHSQEGFEPELPPAMQARFDDVAAIYAQILADTGEDFRYQFPSIKRLARGINEHGGGLDASDTGVGKTAVACAVARVLGRDLFVVCPKSVIAPWRRMAQLFDVEIIVINYEMLRSGSQPYGIAMEKKVYDDNNKPRKKRTFRFNERLLDPESVLMVFDDCHKMKDFRTWNCLMGVQALQQRYRVLGASATAADNPMQMKFVSLLTGLIWHPSEFFGWMQAHGVKRGRFGLQFVGGRDVLAKIHRQIFPARGSRIRIADLGDRFPETRIIADAYDMNGASAEIQAVYDEMHHEIAKLEASEARDRGANILTEQLRARQRIELLKVPTLVEMAHDALEESMSVVLILNFEDSVQAAAQRLGTANTITGKDKPGDRQLLIDRFNDDEEDRVVMNIKCGGVGITLKRTPQSTPTAVLISPSYSGIDLKQALGRCHRAGGARSIQKIVFAAGTIEETACNRVRHKIARIDLLNDNEVTTMLEGL